MQSYRTKLEMIDALCKEHLKVRKDDSYVLAHGMHAAATLNRLNAYEIYRGYLGERILDWGCKFAVDSCMVRFDHPKAQIYGCDLIGPEQYRTFHDYARVEYTQLTDAVKIPYESGTFDTVISGGVLEHVPNDAESMKEIWRVLEPGGYFVITYLPNRFSYTEFLHRLLDSYYHLRLYGMREIRELLLHSGFLPVVARYHQMMPTQLLGVPGREHPLTKKLMMALWRGNGLLEKIWPLNRLSTNLLVVAEKRARL
jgi:SAM-dependent methyltransferase